MIDFLEVTGPIIGMDHLMMAAALFALALTYAGIKFFEYGKNRAAAWLMPAGAVTGAAVFIYLWWAGGLEKVIYIYLVCWLIMAAAFWLTLRIVKDSQSKRPRP